MQQLMNSTLSISKVVPADENNVDGSVGADTCLFWVLIYLRCVAPPLNFGPAKFVVDSRCEAPMPSLVPGRGSNIERLRVATRTRVPSAPLSRSSFFQRAYAYSHPFLRSSVPWRLEPFSIDGARRRYLILDQLNWSTKNIMLSLSYLWLSTLSPLVLVL